MRFDLIQSRYRDARYDIGTGRLSTPIATLERIAREERSSPISDAQLETMATDPWNIPTVLRAQWYSRILEELGQYVDEDAYRAQFSRPVDQNKRSQHLYQQPTSTDYAQIQGEVERQLVVKGATITYPDILLKLRRYDHEAVDFVLGEMVSEGKILSGFDKRGVKLYQGNFDWKNRLRIYFTRPTQN